MTILAPPFVLRSTMQVLNHSIHLGPCSYSSSLGTFSLSREAAGQDNGGADGSLLVDPNEVLRDENNGMQTIVSLLKPLPEKFNVSAGDVLHVRDYFL